MGEGREERALDEEGETNLDELSVHPNPCS